MLRRSIVVLGAVTLVYCFAGRPAQAQITSVDGPGVILRVDSNRLLVGIDASSEGRPPDGVVDHIYLVSLKSSHLVPTGSTSGIVHVEREDGRLLVLIRSHDASQRFEWSTISTEPNTAVAHAAGIAWHRGWGKLEQMSTKSVLRSNECPDACYSWSGRRLEWPR